MVPVGVGPPRTIGQVETRGPAAAILPSDRRFRARQETFYRWLPPAMLVVVTCGVIITGQSRVAPTAAVALSAVTALLDQLAWVRPGRRAGVPSRRGGLSHVTDLAVGTGLVVLAASLVHGVHPLFGFFAWSLFFRLPPLLQGAPRWAAIVAAAAVISWSQTGAPTTPSVDVVPIWLVLILLNSTVAVVVIRFADASERQEGRRIDSLEQLELANRRLESTLAENAGLQAQLVEQAREAGVQAERERFAGEVHDTIAQALTGVVTQLEAMEQSSSPAERQHHLHLARELARTALSEARRSLHAIGPEHLETARLPDAVRDLVQSWGAGSGVKAAFDVAGEPRTLGADAEVALYRSVQEALTNVDKHARATRTVVTLTYTDDEVLLDVRDDGRGLPPGHRFRQGGSGTGGGFGLRSMRQRVAAAGGFARIESEPGAGTTVSVVMPTPTRLHGASEETA